MSPKRRLTVAVQKYEVRLAGRTIIVSSEKEKAHVMRIVDYVEKRMQKIESTVHTADSMRIALMTALTLAEELLDLSDRRNGFR